MNDGQAVIEAIDLEERYRVSYWDALILQAAGSAGATLLYSEDLNHGQEYGNVLVKNPLL
jgi:predicted nucleic acid-binding protein